MHVCPCIWGSRPDKMVQLHLGYKRHFQ